MVLQWVDLKSAFKNKIKSGKIINDDLNNILDPILFLEKCKFVLILKIGQFMYEFRNPVKINCDLACEYIVVKEGKEHVSTIFHKSKMALLTINDDYDEFYEENISEPIRNKLDTFQVNKIFKNVDTS